MGRRKVVKRPSGAQLPHRSDPKSTVVVDVVVLKVVVVDKERTNKRHERCKEVFKLIQDVENIVANKHRQQIQQHGKVFAQQDLIASCLLVVVFGFRMRVARKRSDELSLRRRRHVVV